MSLSRSWAGGLLLALVLLGGAQAKRRLPGLAGCKPEDFRENLRDAVRSAKRECLPTLGGFRGIRRIAVKLACVATRLNITGEQEDLDAFVRGLTNDTDFISLFSNSSATCLENLPANLTDAQEAAFVLFCLDKRVPLDCVLRNENGTLCVQALRLLDRRRCSVAIPVKLRNVWRCKLQLWRASGLPFRKFFRKVRASCANKLEFVQDVIACAMERGGLAADGTVNEEALGAAIEAAPNSAGRSAIAMTCNQTDVTEFVQCWSETMRDQCIPAQAAFVARLVPVNVTFT